jgi:DNA gyrase subunit A
VCQNGYGKRTPHDAYRITRRGGMGVKNIKTEGRNGPVIGFVEIIGETDLMMITRSGMVVRIAINDTTLREIGRGTQGVRLIRLKSGDAVGSIARVPKDDADPRTTELDGEAGEEEAEDEEMEVVDPNETDELPDDDVEEEEAEDEEEEDDEE